MGVFEDIEVGDSYETYGRTVTEADVVNFAGVSGDFNHIHTDAERMTDSRFGERIAHGAFVFAVMTGLMWQNRDRETRDSVVAFYGVDRLRFRAPVFIGDTLHAEVEVVETEARDRPPGNGTVRYEVEMVNQDGDVVLSCEMISLLE